VKGFYSHFVLGKLSSENNFECQYPSVLRTTRFKSNSLLSNLHVSAGVIH